MTLESKEEMPGISMLDLQVLANKFPDLEVDFSARPAKGLVELKTLKAKKTAKPGTGTAFMQALCQWADHHKVMLVLQTGVHERADRKSAFKTTTSKSRLKEFYGRFGFVSNYGRRTYRPDLPGSMHRHPPEYRREGKELIKGELGESVVEAKDPQLSALWSDRVGAVPKSCWSNSVQVLRKNKSPDLKYVEGFARRGDGLVFEHGWIEAPDGTVIDATLPDDDLEYFPGVRYSREEIFKKNRYTAPFVWGGANGFGGFKNPGYKDAHDKAWSKLMGIKEGGQRLRQPFLERVLFVYEWMPTSLVWWETFSMYDPIRQIPRENEFGPSMTSLRLELSAQATTRREFRHLHHEQKPLHHYKVEIITGGLSFWLDATSVSVQEAMQTARNVYAQTMSDKPFHPIDFGHLALDRTLAQVTLPISLAMAESEKLRAEMKSDIKARLGESEESDRGESDRVFAEFNLKDVRVFPELPGAPATDDGYWNIKIRLDSGRSRRTGVLAARGDFSATVKHSQADSWRGWWRGALAWEVFGDTLGDLISRLKQGHPYTNYVIQGDIAPLRPRGQGPAGPRGGYPRPPRVPPLPVEQMFSHPWIKSTIKDEVAARLGEGLLQEFRI